MPCSFDKDSSIGGSNLHGMVDLACRKDPSRLSIASLQSVVITKSVYNHVLLQPASYVNTANSVDISRLCAPVLSYRIETNMVRLNFPKPQQHPF